MRTFIIISLVMLLACAKKDSTLNNPTSTTPVSITENIHSSLPSAWVAEFGTIKSNLLSVLPLFQTYYTDIVIYAWNDNVEDPFDGVEGGAYISTENNNQNAKRFVMEIPNDEFTNNSLHRYSVIAHEYFHCYQQTLNYFMNKANDDPEGFDIKWLIEGPAAAVEGMYIQQYYGFDYITNDQNQVNTAVFSTPSKYEAHSTSQGIDTNYSSSVFMVLVLAKELQLMGHSEAEAFKLIFKDYMATQPQDSNWKNKFASTFGLTVDAFYAKLATYTGQDNSNVSPTNTLKLQQIFN